MLEIDQTLNSSRKLAGGLGAIAFSVLEGFRQAGADDQIVEQTEAWLNEYFAKLSDNDCNVLCEVVEKRLQEDKGAEGRWY